MNQSLLVRILSPGQILFAGEVNSVSSKNMQGPFDILPEHANFITVTEEPIVLRLSDQKPKAFKFPIAIIYAHQNRVDIYTYP